MEGFLVVDKPVGLSSFQVVAKVRKVSGAKKVGHAGTLDPFASGVLVLALGKSYTTQISTVQAMEKEYVTTMGFGLQTDTDDCYGRLGSEALFEKVTEEAVAKALLDYQGEIEQMPPHFSAKKINGERAYKLALKGEVPDLKPSLITIYSNDLLWFKKEGLPFACVKTVCSKGTYIRSLVRDIASTLGTVAYTKDLIRTAVGPYVLEDALSYSDLTAESIKARLQRR